MSARVNRREFEALKARVAELEKAHKIEDPVKED